MPAAAPKAPEMLICIESFVDTSLEGMRYVRGVTLIDVDDPILKKNPTWRKFFEPATTTKARIEQATNNPGEVRF